MLAISLPLITNLVQKSQDNRSSASEAGNIKISFKFSIEGVKPIENNSLCLNNSNQVTFDLKNVTYNSSQTNITTTFSPVVGEVNTNGDQVFKTNEVTLDSKFNSVTDLNYLKVRWPFTLKSIMCVDNQGGLIADGSVCSLSLSNGSVFDFSEYPLKTGDINNDGLVNGVDFSYIKVRFKSGANVSCGIEADLNLDGVVNGLDGVLVKKNLLQADDITYFSPSLSAPLTPTSKPTTIITNPTSGPTSIPTIAPTPTDNEEYDPDEPDEPDEPTTTPGITPTITPGTTPAPTPADGSLSYQQLIQPINMNSIKTKMGRSEYKFDSKKNVNFSYIEPTLPTKGSFKRSDIIRAARSLLGIPYWMGGGHHYSGNSEHIYNGIDPDWGKKVTAPKEGQTNAKRTYHGLDCSGFVRWVYKYVTGKNVGNRAADIYKASEKISKSQLKPGDIGFYSSSSGNHIGIFLGKGTDGKYYYIHSSGYSSKAGPQQLGGVYISAFKFTNFGRIKVNLQDQ